jgi:hypothetical protein
MKLTITLMTGAGRSGVMAGALRVKLKPSPNRAHARALPLKRQVLAFAKSSKERLMRRSIGTAAAAFAIFIGSSMVSLAAERHQREKRELPARLRGKVLAVPVQHTIPIRRRLPRLEWKIGAEAKWAAIHQHNPAGKKD